MLVVSSTPLSSRRREKRGKRTDIPLAMPGWRERRNKHWCFRYRQCSNNSPIALDRPVTSCVYLRQSEIRTFDFPNLLPQVVLIRGNVGTEAGVGCCYSPVSAPAKNPGPHL